MFLTWLTDQIQQMQPHNSLYKVLKRELTALGHWRNLPRGKPDRQINKRRTTTLSTDNYDQRPDNPDVDY